MELNEDIAEFLGLHVGDGTFYKTNTGLVWEGRGDLNEKDYYIDNVSPLMERIFGLEFVSKFRSGGKNGVWGIQTSKRVVTDFLFYYGFNPGKKAKTVKIPDKIFKANRSIKKAFLRGLFDTDGCLRFDKPRNKTKHTYPKIEIGVASKSLRDDTFCLLNELGFKSYIWKDGDDAFKLCLAGEMKLEKWIREIGFNNLKHENKYLIWKKKGFFPMPQKK